ncbi:PREDICTED: proline-rich protein 3-like [Populus euphratica]|uniref:Proline-rich protein 3-like n=1 Tax=Populus euphratica TaxID=75702 RepID=A0AAJ6Y4G0_POPEU|nr:PREDICTED: proline-rich protein 3-like [Populus euphratica]
MTVPKPDHGYDPKEKVYEQPKSTTPKPEIITAHDGYAQKPNLPEPKLYVPIGIEGFVLCKQGSNYTPIEGAVIRIACTAVDHYGYKKVPFSCLTEATNAKGYYFKTLPALKLTECKAYLESSPLKTCNVPTDMNYGITGAPLSAYHILHDKKIKLYSMRTFFYTSTTPTSTPAGY